VITRQAERTRLSTVPIRGSHTSTNTSKRGYHTSRVIRSSAAMKPSPVRAQPRPHLQSMSNLRQWPLTNLDAFIERMNATNTSSIIMTGTTTDPQLYKHESKLLDLLRSSIPQSHISLHTNGLLALSKLNVFNSYNTSTISLQSFNPETYATIHGVKSMPNLKEVPSQLDTLSC